MLREQGKKVSDCLIVSCCCKKSLLNQANAPRQQQIGSRGN
jgi:hypothetical protein